MVDPIRPAACRFHSHAFASWAVWGERERNWRGDPERPAGRAAGLPGELVEGFGDAKRPFWQPPLFIGEMGRLKPAPQDAASGNCHSRGRNTPIE